MWAGGSPLNNQTYRRLFAAQVVALIGTGISTVALALLASELAPTQAGFLLGSVLGLKMIVYVTISLASPALVRLVSPLLSPKQLMIALDILRAVLLLFLPFVKETWQIYVLISGISACSAAFKPIFQSIIPTLLESKAQYTKALSLTRLAYDMENLLSPALAAALLAIMDARLLFGAATFGFLFSALWIQSAALEHIHPSGAIESPRLCWRSFFHAPTLRAVIALNLCVAAGGTAMIVSGVHYIRIDLGLAESSVAHAMMATGAGSILVALSLPLLVMKMRTHLVMGLGAAVICLSLYFTSRRPSFEHLLLLWFLMGAAGAAIQTPIGRLITECLPAKDHPGAFAIQFSLSHACWLLTYTLAAWLPTYDSSSVIFQTFAAVALGAASFALFLGCKQTRQDAEPSNGVSVNSAPK